MADKLLRVPGPRSEPPGLDSERDRGARSARAQADRAQAGTAQDGTVAGAPGQVASRSPDDHQSPAAGSPRVVLKPGGRAIGPGTGLDVLGLQRTMGNAVVVSLLQRAETVSSAAEAVQRKVGFEFEESTWSPWRKSYRKGSGYLYDMVGGSYDVFPVERKQVVHTGPMYTAEADDTFGPRRPSLEFVTKPFEESDQGLQQLEQAMLDISSVMARIAQFKGTEGPGGEPNVKPPPYDFDADKYVEPSQHRFTGSSDVPRDAVLLSGGHSRGQFKMQATSSTSLADLPAQMEYFGDPGNTGAVAADDRRAAGQLVRGKKAPGDASKVLGRCPALAREVAKRVKTDAKKSKELVETFEGDLVALLDGDDGSLVGFLSAVMLYVKMLQLPLDNVLKYRIPFHARRSFSVMFAALPDHFQHALAHNKAELLVKHVVAVCNENPLLPDQVDSGLGPDSALVRKPQNITKGPPMESFERIGTISIGTWLEGMTVDLDFLTPGTLALLAQGLSPQQQENDTSLVESFASLDNEANAGQLPPAIFENRGIDPPAFGQLVIDEAMEMAWNYLLFYARWKQSGQPGKFPSNKFGER